MIESMRDNPFKSEILAQIMARPAGISEFELVECLPKIHPLLSAGREGRNLILFRKHFLVMNALYQLQSELFEQGRYLAISPLEIRLEPAGNSEVASLPSDGAAAALREYYLDWNQFEQTDDTEVNDMLTRFWGRFLAIDKRLEALETLGLPADAAWETVKRTYRQLAAKHHPDKGGDATRFRAIREAYEVLLHCYAV
jgi:hypothetical protein